MKLLSKLRHLPMKRRPSETIHVLAEQPAPAEAEMPMPGMPTPPAPINPRYTRLPRAVIVIYIITAIAAILYAIGIASPAFADFFNRYFSSAIRMVMATLTNWLPFSLAETLLLFLPVIFVSLIVYAVRHRCDSWRTVFVYIGEVLAIVAVLLSLFVSSFGMAYQGTPLEDKLGLEREKVTVEELAYTMDILIDHINTNAEQVDFRHQNFSVMPYSLEELNDKLLHAYAKLEDVLPFMPRFHSDLKPVINSELMSHAHITGIYTYFTGEANLNMVFPDYTLPFTAAHELAHQRGIAREDEANFIAFLVCISSDDPYIRYSGYLNMYEYVAPALSGADPETYSALRAKLDSRAQYEQIAYSAFYAKYRHSKVSTVSNAVNDTYLKLQGTPGAQSYGMVVDLAVAYYRISNES